MLNVRTVITYFTLMGHLFSCFSSEISSSTLSLLAERDRFAGLAIQRFKTAKSNIELCPCIITWCMCWNLLGS